MLVAVGVLVGVGVLVAGAGSGGCVGDGGSTSDNEKMSWRFQKRVNVFERQYQTKAG